MSKTKQPPTHISACKVIYLLSILTFLLLGFTYLVTPQEAVMAMNAKLKSSFCTYLPNAFDWDAALTTDSRTIDGLNSVHIIEANELGMFYSLFLSCF
jgi:hypothetical protein